MSPVVAADYLRYFAEKIGAGEPRRVPEWIARLLAGPAAVDFLTASTQTSNERFCRDFGWSPRYPSYRMRAWTRLSQRLAGRKFPPPRRQIRWIGGSR